MIKKLSRMQILRKASAILMICALVLSNVSTLAVTAAVSTSSLTASDGIYTSVPSGSNNGLYTDASTTIITGKVDAVKTAEWTNYETGEAEISFTLSGTASDDNKTNADVIFVLDASVSMAMYDEDGYAYGDTDGYSYSEITETSTTGTGKYTATTTTVLDAQEVALNEGIADAKMENSEWAYYYSTSSENYILANYGTGSRWDSALTAVSTAATSLLSDDGNNVSLITFRGKYADNQNKDDGNDDYESPVTYYSQYFTTSASVITSLINEIELNEYTETSTNGISSDTITDPGWASVDGGTDYTSALEQAIVYAEALGTDDNDYDRELHVIFISDGAPDGTAYNGVDAAATLMKDYKATIYPVSIGDTATASGLDNLNTGMTVITTSGSDLNSVLLQIVQDITIVAEDVQIDDVISEEFALDTDALGKLGYVGETKNGVTTYTHDMYPTITVTTVDGIDSVSIDAGDLTENGLTITIPIVLDSEYLTVDGDYETNDSASVTCTVTTSDSSTTKIIISDLDTETLKSPEVLVRTGEITVQYINKDTGEIVCIETIEEQSIDTDTGSTIVSVAANMELAQLVNYTLVGSTTAKATLSYDSENDEVTDATVTFVVDLNGYTVTYDANGGVGDTVVADYAVTENAMIAENTFTKTGYSFTGWNTEDDGSGTAYAVNDTNYKGAADTNLTLYAQWKANKYTVNFMNDDLLYETFTQDYGTTFNEPDEPTKAADADYEYVFSYWGDDQGAKVTVETTITENVTYYAYYTSIPKLVIDESSLEAAGYNGEYDAASHEGVIDTELTVSDATNSVKDTDYHYEYSTDGGTTWETTIPQVKDVSDSKTILVKAVSNDSSKFIDSEPVEVTATVTKATITVSVNNETMTYGTTVPTFTSGVTGIKEDYTDTIIASLNRKYTEFINPPVDTYDIVVSGVDSLDNYNVVYKNGTLTVTASSAMTIEVSGTAYNGTYDATAHDVLVENAVSVVNVTEGTTVKIEYSIDDGETWSENIPEVTNAGSYIVDIKATATNANYAIVTASATVTATVSKATITVTAGSDTIVYGKETPIFGYTVVNSITSDIVAGVTVKGASVSVAETGILSVGKYTTTATGGTVVNGDGTENNNYEIDYVNGELAVTQATATITIDNAGKTYGEVDPTEYTSVVTGVIEGDDLDYTLSRESGQNAGEYTISATLGDNPNYNVTVENGIFTISQKEVTLTIHDIEITYGDAEPTLTAEYEGTINDDILTYVLSRDTGNNVGEYDIEATSCTVSDNYYVTVKEGTLRINPKALTLTVEDATKVYGEDDPEFEATTDELEGTDTLSYTFSRTTGENVVEGGYEITANVTKNENYDVTVVPGTLTITPAEVTVTVASDSKTYGEDDPTFEAEVVGMKNNEELDYTLSRAEGEDVIEGGYAITAVVTDNANYTVTVNDGTLTIDKAEVTVTVASYSKTYGDVDPTFEAEVVGMKYGEKLDYTLSRELGDDVDTYAITADVTDNDNYDVTVVPGTLTITTAKAIITVASDSKIYGEDDPTFEATVTGEIDGDELEYTLSRDDGDDVGTYTIKATVTSDTNYTVEVVTGTLEITQAPVTVTVVSYSKTYGDVDPTFEAEVVGMKYGEKLEYTLSRELGDNVGEYEITAKVTENKNYEVTVESGTLTINPKALTLTVKDATKVYGENDPKFVATTDDLVGTDTLSYTFSRAAGENVIEGGYEITAVVEEDANYTISVVPGTLTINPKALTLTVGNATKVYGENDPTFEATTDDLEGTDTLSYTFSRTTGENVIEGGYAITAVVEADANYTITVEPGILEITPAEVTVTVASDSKTYGEDDPELTATVTGLEYDDKLVYVVSRADGENVGTYAITADVTPDANYDVTVVSGTLTINPAEVIVTVADAGKTYGAEDPELTATVDGMKYDEALEYTLSRVDGDDVGTYEITANVTVNPNYIVAVNEGTFTISPASLTVTAVNALMEYATELPELTTEVVGLQGDDEFTFVATTDATAESSVGDYVIDVVEQELANYTVEYVSGTLTVHTSDALVAAGTGYAGAYDAAEHELVTSVETSIEGATVEYSLDGGATWTEEVPTGMNAGSYEVDVRVSEEGYDSYEVTVIATITPAAVTITVGNAAKALGDADPTFTASVSGLAGTDTLAYTVLRGTAEDAVGQQALSATYVADSNYTVTVLDGIFIITAAAADDDADDDDTDDGTTTTTTTTDTGVGAATVEVEEDTTVEIEADEVPLAEEVEDEATTEIEEEEVPLAASVASDSWALLNLILAILTAASSVVLLIGYFINRKADEEEEQELEESKELVRKNKGIMRLASLAPAIVAVVVFILTENMLNPMVIVDQWTVVMLIIALVQAVVAFAARKKDVEEEQKDEVYVQ